MRKKFFEDDNLRVAYAFCLAICRKGNLSGAKFRSMLKRADRKRVWAYVDIPLWSIPYILLTLENFTDTKKGYEFYFAFNKPINSNITALWKKQKECEIVKFFPSSEREVEGHIVKYKEKKVNSKDNPYPVSEMAILDKAGDTAWIDQKLLQSLKI